MMAAAAAALLAATALANAQAFTYTELTLPGVPSSDFMSPSGINAKGQIVGVVDLPDSTGAAVAQGFS